MIASALPSGFLLRHIPTALRQLACRTGQFLYGDARRTHYTLCFAYGCIGLYLLAVINAPAYSACAM